MAFSNTKFASKKCKDICAAQKEAQEARVGIWSTGGLAQMGASKQRNLKKMTSTCQRAMEQESSCQAASGLGGAAPWRLIIP